MTDRLQGPPPWEFVAETVVLSGITQPHHIVTVKNVQWRIGPPVDASGTTPDGKPFKDLTDYKKLILAQPERFTRALSEKLAVYATGRGMGFSDRSELNRIASTTYNKGNGLRDLVHEVIQSELFRNK